MKSSIYSIVVNAVKTAVAEIVKDRNGYFKFGANDNFPNELINDITASGTAKSCLNRLVQFTKADGFVNKEVSQKFANKKQKFDEFLDSLALQVVFSNAVSFRVLYNNMGEPVKFISTPINQIRRRGELFRFNKNFGDRTNYRQTEDKIIHEFNPEESPQARLKRIDFQVREYKEQIGDLVFVFKEGLGNFGGVYPIPDYYSEAAVNDIRSDAAISRIELRNITKGFRAQVVIATGEYDDTNEDENGKTNKDYLVDTLKSFTGEEGGSIMHLEAKTKEEMPTVTVLPVADILNATEQVTKRVGEKVCRHFNVPPVLVGFSTPGQLGNNQELINSIKLMSLSVFSYQSLISSALKFVLPNLDWTISTLNIFDFLPPEVLARLTDAELRELYGLNPKPNEATQVTV